MNAVADVVVRALVIIFAFAAGAFLEDIVSGDLGAQLALGGRVLAVVVAVVWGFLDGRATHDIRWTLGQWVAAAILVGLAAGFVFKLVFDRASNGADPASWFGLGIFPALITLLPALAAAGLGYVLRSHLGPGARRVEQESS
ncbi:MAG TPA: hypothetical protein GXZ60_13665 [Intrasporangiaceae bacterium]|nr:hypothetical protein [Intrasporangiaceae bacterium]